MTEDQARGRLREAVQAVGSLRQAATRWGVALSHLSKVLRGQGHIGPALCKVLGLSQHVTYQRES